MYLVIDQGGHATRALVFDLFGKIICHAESKITTIEKGDLIVEHDPEQLIQSVFNVLDDIYEVLGVKFANIVDAGIATQRSSFVCWNKITGDALTPIISWQDRRTVDDLARYLPAKELIHQQTGLYLNPHYGATKIRWCLDSDTGLDSEESCIGPLASFILFHLLEERPFKVDPANASRMLLMNYQALDWDDDLLSVFDISQNLLPEIVDTKSKYGTINYKGHRIPLSVCTGDQSAAIYFQGKPSQESLYVNMGTGAFVQQYCHQLPSSGDEKLLTSIVYSEQDRREYVIEGTVNGAARALDWLAEKSNVANYVSKLDEWSDEFEAPPVFLNGISGVGSPFWIARLDSRFLGESLLGAQFVAVMESIVFLICYNISSMKVLGHDPECIEVSGGLSQSLSICQKLADLSGLLVRRCAEPEATAKGVAFLVLGAVGAQKKTKEKEFLSNKNNLLISRYHLWKSEMNKIS